MSVLTSNRRETDRRLKLCKMTKNLISITFIALLNMNSNVSFSKFFNFQTFKNNPCSSLQWLKILRGTHYKTFMYIYIFFPMGESGGVFP